MMAAACLVQAATNTFLQVPHLSWDQTPWPIIGLHAILGCTRTTLFFIALSGITLHLLWFHVDLKRVPIELIKGYFFLKVAVWIVGLLLSLPRGIMGMLQRKTPDFIGTGFGIMEFSPPFPNSMLMYLAESVIYVAAISLVWCSSKKRFEFKTVPDESAPLPPTPTPEHSSEAESG